MRFTHEQYEQAINDLKAAQKQLEPNAKPCSICGDNGHQAWECGFNPLLAMHLCNVISKQAKKLHETLHYLAGFDFHMITQLGPRNIRSLNND